VVVVAVLTHQEHNFLEVLVAVVVAVLTQHNKVPTELLTQAVAEVAVDIQEVANQEVLVALESLSFLTKIKGILGSLFYNDKNCL